MAFDWLESALRARRESALYRTRRTLSSAQSVEVVVEGRNCINFCSNDYLGLANDPTIKQALIAAVERCGVGSGASHLVIGHHEEHERLENALAKATGRDRALVFSTGYMANMGVISALLGKRDWVFEDRLNHASLLDGGLASGARFQRYLHNDLASIEQKLERASDGERLIVTDGVFSMDGDMALLPELSRLAKQYDSWVMVDDAHGMGVLGETGMGTLEHFGLTQDDVPILMGTLGKGFGTFGAFVAGSEALIEYLINEARTAIYTTALPPAVAAATHASLKVVLAAQDKRQHLKLLVSNFRQQAKSLELPLLESITPIQPIIIGESDAALQWSKKLASMGLIVSAIRPPTVPDGSARLRVTFSANHTAEHLEQLICGLKACVSQFGLPASGESGQ